MTIRALLALEDGTLFWGEAVGARAEAVGEVVFNTAMTGYQEILTDPSYCRQIVTLTYPHIGNTGVNVADEEAHRIHASGLVIRELPRLASSWRAESDLSAYLRERGVAAIAGVDTRRLTRLLRERGAQNGCLVAGDGVDPEYAVAAARAFPGIAGMDLARVVSTREGYAWREGAWAQGPQGWAYEQPAEDSLIRHVVAYDFGIKRNILRMLVARGCRVTVVPADTRARDTLALEPDGVFLSNGPGDPEPCAYAVTAVRELVEANVPVFGICLGVQLLGLASGARTVKMKFGHHGANHPVVDVESGRVLITSQNHGFAVEEASLPANVRPTHRSLFDGSLQGIRLVDRPAFGFQGHPEASPGPHDPGYLFDRFVELMERAGRDAAASRLRMG